MTSTTSIDASLGDWVEPCGVCGAWSFSFSIVGSGAGVSGISPMARDDGGSPDAPDGIDGVVAMSDSSSF